jgi:hypothetical protein
LKYKVISHLGGTPNPARNNHKTQLLRDIISGVLLSGDIGSVQVERKALDCHVAVLQGFVHPQSERVPHLIFRQAILDKQKLDGNHTLIADSNLFNYKVGTHHPANYHRYSFDGVFGNTGNYFGNNPDPLRWEKISKELDIKVKKWRKNGKHILICCQRNGGWSMKGTPVPDWLLTVINEIKKFSDREIIIRAHPGDKRAMSYIKPLKGRIATKHKISTARNISEDLKDAWCTITYNSSPGVASAIEGIPVYVTDPKPDTSQSYEIANTSISNIESPNMPDRIEWLQKLAMCHWSKDELRTGEAWRHFRKFI